MTKRRMSKKKAQQRVKVWGIGVVLLGGMWLIGSAGGDDDQVSARAPEAPAPAPVETSAAAPTETAEAAPEPSETETAETVAGTALAAVEELTVKGRAPKTGYERDEFGSGWLDPDGNGCDARSDMLALRMENVVKSGSCDVDSGDLLDPFTGQWIAFERGGSSEVDVDHLVALSDAWQKGAFQWDDAKREALANDPLNLEPVDAGENRSKGDGDAATWLPPNKDFRCQYIARQVAVKVKYDVWVTEAEKAAMVDVLSSCPEEPLPDAGTIPVVEDSTGGPAPADEPEPAETEAPAADGDTDPNWGTCKEAKANGGGPYVRDVDPEYEFYQDRDGDGVVCE